MRVELKDAEPIELTVRDYSLTASGLSLLLPDDVWMVIPIERVNYFYIRRPAH